jgi:hypothetical protein
VNEVSSSKEPNRVGVSFQLRTEADPVSETSCYLIILDFRTMDEVQKAISSQWIVSLFDGCT